MLFDRSLFSVRTEISCRCQLGKCAELLPQFWVSPNLHVICISTDVASMRYSGSTMLSLRLAPHIILQCGLTPRNQHFLVTILILIVGLGIVRSLIVKGHFRLSRAYGKQPNVFGIYFSQFCERLYLKLQKNVRCSIVKFCKTILYFLFVIFLVHLIYLFVVLSLSATVKILSIFEYDILLVDVLESCVLNATNKLTGSDAKPNPASKNRQVA